MEPDCHHDNTEFLKKEKNSLSLAVLFPPAA